MKRVIGLAVGFAMLGASAMAAIKTERIEYKQGETTLKGVLAYDDQQKPDQKRPGVLVCPEWWGNNEYSESRARQLAELGYVAFAIDMYGDGKTTTDPKVAAEWAGKVNTDTRLVRERAAAGLKVLAENPRVDTGRLAAIGYCMGGTVALELARSGLPHTQDLKAITAFHASTLAAKDASDNRNIKGKVLVCHGGADTFVKPEQIENFKKQMDEAKVPYQFETYEGAVHAFTNPNADKFNVPGVKYDAKADHASWEAMKALLAERLGPGGPAREGEKKAGGNSRAKP